MVQWLRDAMGIIATAPAVEALAKTAKPYEGLYFVPAFTGLVRYWGPLLGPQGARRDIGPDPRHGKGRSGGGEALDAVCYQTHDLLEAMTRDMARARIRLRELKVDGGMVAIICQRLADLTGLAWWRGPHHRNHGAWCCPGRGHLLRRSRRDRVALGAGPARLAAANESGAARSALSRLAEERCSV